MSTCGKKFTPIIECGPLRSKHDEVFLLKTKAAGSSGWIKTGAACYDFPGYFVRNFSSFQLPYVVAEASPLSTPVVEVLRVLIISDLECAGCKAGVGLNGGIVLPFDHGLVNYPLFPTLE